MKRYIFTFKRLQFFKVFYEIKNNENYHAIRTTTTFVVLIIATKLRLRYLTRDLRQLQNNLITLVVLNIYKFLRLGLKKPHSILVGCLLKKICDSTTYCYLWTLLKYEKNKKPTCY